MVVYNFPSKIGNASLSQGSVDCIDEAGCSSGSIPGFRKWKWFFSFTTRSCAGLVASPSSPVPCASNAPPLGAVDRWVTENRAFPYTGEGWGGPLEQALVNPAPEYAHHSFAWDGERPHRARAEWAWMGEPVVAIV